MITRPHDAGGEAREQAGGFPIAWSAHGLRYGRPAAPSDALKQGRHVVANGSRATISELAARVPRLVVLAVSAERGALAERIRGRGRESGTEIEQRLARDVSVAVPAGAELIAIHNNGSVEEGVEQFLAALDDAERNLRVVRNCCTHPPAAGLMRSRSWFGATSTDSARSPVRWA